MPQNTAASRSQALSQVREAARQYRDAISPRSQRIAREALHKAVVLAVQAGAKQAEVVRTTGLSKAQVSRVARGGSSGRSQLPAVKYLIDTLPVVEVIERYRVGESTRQLGAAFGCSRDTIREVLKSHGVPRNHPTGPSKVALPKAEILERHRSGESARRIARAYGVSYMTVLRRVHEDWS